MKLSDKKIIEALKSGKYIRRKVWHEGYVVDYDSYCDVFVRHEEDEYD